MKIWGHSARGRGRSSPPATSVRPESLPRGIGRLLLHADLAEPSVQTLPHSIGIANGITGRTFTEVYLGNMASGNLVGVGGTTLTKGAGTIRYARTVPGWNGTDMTSGFRACEFTGTGVADKFESADTSLYDLDESLTFVLCTRLLRGPSSTRGVFGKRAGATGTSAGYQVQVSTTGVPAMEVADGSTEALINGPGVSTALDALGSGAVQWWAAKINLSTGMGQILAYRDSGAEVALPAGAKTTVTPFRVGAMPFLFSCELLQVLWFGVLAGAEAEAFDIDDLNALDNWCRVPSVFSTYTRAGVIAPIVGEDATGVRVQHCAGSTTTSNLMHFAHRYSADDTTTSQKLGALSGQASADSSDTAATGLKKRNRLLRTDDFNNAAWTKTNVTTAANAGDDPAGFQGAASLTATANAGAVTQDFTGEVDEVHTISFFAQRNQATDVAARLSLCDSADDSELAGVDITIGALRERFSLEVDDLLVDVTTLRWKLTITTSGESIFATFAQAEFGTLTSYMPQLGTLVDKARTEWGIDNTGNTVYDPSGGRVEVTVFGEASSAPYGGAFVFTTDAGASFEDRHFIQRDALNSAVESDARIYDGAGVLASSLTLPTVADYTATKTYISDWRADGVLPATSVRHRAIVDGEEVVTGATVAAADWTPSTNADRLLPGMRHSYTAQIEGGITRLRVWGPWED